MPSVKRAAVWLSVVGLAGTAAAIAFGPEMCLRAEPVSGCGAEYWNYVLGIGTGMAAIGIPTAVLAMAYDRVAGRY